MKTLDFIVKLTVANTFLALVDNICTEGSCSVVCPFGFLPSVQLISQHSMRLLKEGS